MNIQDILASNNISYFNLYYLPLKKYLLYDLINDKSITQYNNIVQYFLSATEINQITQTDINFKDSLENKQIANILLSVLNDSNICDLYNTNQIIILDNIELYQSNEIHLSTTFNSVLKYDESLFNVDKEKELITTNIKLLNNNNDINYNLNIIDNIYFQITGNKKKYSLLYEIIKPLSIKSIVEIKKRIREIKLIIKPIYQIVHESEEDDPDLESDYSTLLNMIQVILIIKTKIDLILKEKNIILLTYDLNTYRKNLVDILETDPNIIKELLKIFNYSEDQIENELIESDIIEHILNSLENYYNIESIIKKNILSNEIEVVSYLEDLYEEYETLNEMLNVYLDNSIDVIIKDFIISICATLNSPSELIDNIIKLLINLTMEIKENNNVLLLDQRLIDLKNENNQNNNREIIKILKNKQNIDILTSQILYSFNETSTIQEYIDINLFIINENINNINYQIKNIIEFYKNEYDIETTLDSIVNLLVNSNIIYNHNKYNLINIFENKKIFLEFINDILIDQKEINLKNDILLLMLFKFKSNEKTNEWFDRHSIDGLSFYNNNFILDKIDLKIVLNKLEDYFTEIINML
jgi:hypothetical protein